MKVATRIYMLLATVLLTGVLFYSGSGGCGCGSAISPEILSVYPADGATGVAVDITVEAVFDRPMEASTINTQTISLRLYSGPELSGESPDLDGEVSYDPSSNKAGFTPADNLAYNTEYIATISGSVEDALGNPIGEDFSWRFTTLAADEYLSMDLDPDFGVGGKLTIDPGRNFAMGAAIRIQSDGKIVTSGYNGDSILGQDAKLAIVRTDAAGNLDAGFGTGGITTMDCTSKKGLNWWAKQGLALQSDGKILVGGECDLVATVFRINSDGSADPSFGVNGKVALPTDPGQVHSSVFVLATQQVGAEEKIVVGGQLEPASWRARWLLARLNADGSLDNTFAGGAGILFQQWRYYDEGVMDMAVLPDGRIIAYGSSAKAAGLNQSDFAVARYSADGALDLTFAVGDAAGVPGLAVIDFDSGLNEWPFSMQVMADGRIVGGVHVNADDTGATLDNDFGVFRLTADGVLDTSFGTDGKVEIDFGFHDIDIGNSIVLLPDGQMILGGEANNGTPNPPGGWDFWSNNDFGLVMLDAEGNINEHFGSSGFIWTDFMGDHDDILAMVLDNVVTDDSGKVESFDLFATGLAKDPASGDLRYAVAKYNSFIVEVEP